MALKGTARGAEEATRGALLATHSAAGLVQPVSREATRLVRTAEGLLRAAIALLRAPPPDTADVPALAKLPGGRRRRRGQRKGKAADQEKVVQERVVEDVVMEKPNVKQTSHSTRADVPKGVEAPLVAAGASASLQIDRYVDGGELVELGCQSADMLESAASTSAGGGASCLQSSSGGRPRHFCSCKFGQPLPKSLRCMGCGWQWAKKQLKWLEKEKEKQRKLLC